jgi:hypothetical protein
MSRYRLPLAGIAVLALLASSYFMVQRETYAATGLVLQQKFEDHKYAVYTADFDENEELVASGGEDGLRIWRLDNGSQLYHRPGRIYLVRFVRNGPLVCADANEGVLLLDRKTWQVQKKFGHKAVRIVAAVSDSGDKIAASFSVARKDDKVPPMSTEIYVWQLVNGKWNRDVQSQVQHQPEGWLKKTSLGVW